MFRYALLLLSLTTTLQAQTDVDSGGQEFNIERTGPCIPPTTRDQVFRDIKQNIEHLGIKANKTDTKKKSLQPSFIFPLVIKENDFYFSYFGIDGFVDHNPVATGSYYGSSNLDYFCGNRTYDVASGYNHKGTDISLFPFAWHMMDNDLVSIIAAEAGTIVAKYDGYYDRNCSWVGGRSNSVHIQHTDGSQAWYWHMKENSLTSKLIGDTVEKGEFLGVVGSSGSSRAPHLHFEVYDANNNLIDPYSGNCNSLNTSSWWESQEVYQNPKLNALLSHSSPPPAYICGASQGPDDFKNCFNPGETVYAMYFYTNLIAGMNTHLSLIQPDGTVWDEWDYTAPQDYMFRYNYRASILPASAPFGTWQISAEFNGSTYNYKFYFGNRDCDCPAEYSEAFGNQLTGELNASSEYESFGLLESNQNLTSGADVIYDSGTAIYLKTPFAIESGATFTALIDGCGDE